MNIRSIIVILLCIFVLPLQAQEQDPFIRFMDSLKQEGVIPEDNGWNDAFEERFEQLYRGSMVHPNTLSLAVRTMSRTRITADPKKSADLLFSAVRDADMAVKRGQPPVRVEQELRQTIKRVTTAEQKQSGQPPSIAGDRRKERVNNMFENRGRGNDESFVPPGLGRKEEGPFQKEDRAPPAGKPEDTGEPDDTGRPDTEQDGPGLPDQDNPNTGPSNGEDDQNPSDPDVPVRRIIR